MLVDDEKKICELLNTMLTQDGYAVDVAYSAPDAIEQMEGGDHDLLITDIKMPGMDGLELANRVRNFDENLPVVAITGYATIDTAVQALRQGIDDYVAKPFKARDIRRVIDKVLEKARLASENRHLVEHLEVANEKLQNHKDVLLEKVQEASKDLRMANNALRRKVGELRMLNEVGTFAASELDLEKLLDNCVRLVADRLQVNRVTICMKEGNMVHVRACCHQRGPSTGGERQNIGDGIAGRVLASGEPILIEDVTSDSRAIKDMEGKHAEKSCVCVPLSYKGSNLGTLFIADRDNGEPFGEEHVNLLSTIASHVAPAIENARLYKSLEESALSTVKALAAGMEAKDEYLRGHSQRVTRYARAIGEAMGLDGRALVQVERGSQLHDLGKIGVPDQILNKPTSLTRDEFAVIKQHPQLGANILKPLDFMDWVRPAIRDHHERPDGQGYPGDSGWRDVSRSGKIISVADAFDAMVSNRSYRPPNSPDQARREIDRKKGKQFDEEIAEAFCDSVFPERCMEMQDYEKAG